MRPFRIVRLAPLAAAISIAVGCGGDRPASPPHPTPDRVVADSRAIGVPYDVCVLLRDGDRLLALKISSRSPLGEHISYSWEEIHRADPGSTPPVDRGRGETSEDHRQLMGRIDLPGLSLRWSRGSSDLGWIYWPDDRQDFAVFSRTWLRPAEIDPSSRSGKWLERN